MSQANGIAKHDFKYIGKPRPIIDGMEKVTGYAKYTGDLNLPGMLYIRPILAQMANAIIEEIDASEAGVCNFQNVSQNFVPRALRRVQRV